MLDFLLWLELVRSVLVGVSLGGFITSRRNSSLGVEVWGAVASAAAPYQSRSTASTVNNKKKAQAHTFYRWGCTSAFSMVQVMLVPLEHSEVGPREGREVRDPGEKTESPCKTHGTLSFLFVSRPPRAR